MFKYEKLPPFIKREGNSLVYNPQSEGFELHYYIPENYFSSRKAELDGQFVRLLGSFSYRQVNNNKPGELKLFNFPSVFLCKPSYVEKEKEYKLNDILDASDYRILVFKKGDQLVSDVFIPQNIDNVYELISLHINTGKIPQGIPYDELYLYPYESMKLNGASLDIHTQALALVYSKICRDPADPKKLFRLSKSLDKDILSFKPISIKEVPKYTSPFIAITSENIDEGIIASVLLSEDEKNGEIDHISSPLEKVVTT